MNAKCKSVAALAATVVVLCACTMNSNKATSWGKENVSLLDFQADTLACGTVAGMEVGENAGRTAGGMDGRNGTGRIPGGETGQSGGAGGSGTAGTMTSIGGGTYEGHVSGDMASRAANQQRTTEIQAKQARQESLRSCLTKRGYTEFELTSDQRQELAQLQRGTDARQQYLHKLGTNPDNLKNAVRR